MKLGKKKFLLPLILAGALVLVGGGGVLGALFFSQTNPATINVEGAGIVLYQDEACTTPLPDTFELDFGSIRAEQSSTETINLWAKNTGTDPVTASIYQENLPSFLHLYEGTDLVPDDETSLSLEGPSIEFTEALSTTGGALMIADETTTQIKLGWDQGSNGTYDVGWSPTQIDTACPGGGVLKAGDGTFEYITFTGSSTLVEGPDTFSILTGVVRGAYGTTATAHAAGYERAIGSAEAIFAEDDVLPISLHLEADEEVEFHEQDFDITITGETTS